MVEMYERALENESCRLEEMRDTLEAASTHTKGLFALAADEMLQVARARRSHAAASACPARKRRRPARKRRHRPPRPKAPPPAPP